MLIECFKGHQKPISGLLGFLQIDLYDCPVWEQGILKIFTAKKIPLPRMILLLLWYSQVFEKGLEISKFFQSSTSHSGLEVSLWAACLSAPDGLQTAQVHLGLTESSSCLGLGLHWWICCLHTQLIWPWEWPWNTLEATVHRYSPSPNQDLCCSFTSA